MQDPAAAAALMGMGPQFPEHEQLKCPRCDSTNTKFCYYNNYNLSQPRHFCKNCRRYWTRGGTLRNIPFGGATRKRNIKRPDSDHEPAPSRIKTSAENLDGSGLKRMEMGGDMKSGQVPDGVGSTSTSFCWSDSNNSNNGWPHLANIYTPGSSFP